MRAWLQTVSRETVVLPIHLWRSVSRLLPPRCKYHPSCSRYCIDCIRQLGIIRGGALSIWRLFRCNPWSLGGVDPVPEARSNMAERRPTTPSRPEAHTAHKKQAPGADWCDGQPPTPPSDRIAR